MKRKLAFLEASLYAGGEMPNQVVATVRVSGCVDECHLRSALAKVQGRHPLLQATIYTDKKGINYFIQRGDIPPIPLVIRNRRGDDDWKELFIPACTQAFGQEDPLIEVIWLRSVDVSDLMFICHHCICDGKSILNLIDETLQLLAKPEGVLMPYDASLPLTNFIPVEVKHNKVNKLISWVLPSLTALALSVASFKKEVKRNQPYFIHWKLSEELTAAALKRCKKEELSIHALLSIIYLAAFQYLEKSKRHQKLYCSVDMRRFIPEITDDMLFAFPAMILLRVAPLTVANIWEQARFFSRKLQTRLDKLDAYGPLMYTECLLPLIPKITRYAKSDKGSHAFTLSNMGQVFIKEQYQDLSVEALYSPACIFPFGNPSTLCVTTFRNQLDFIFTSEESFLAHQEACIVRDKAMGLLAELIVLQ